MGWRRDFEKYLHILFKHGVRIISFHFKELVEKPGCKLGKICLLMGMHYFGGKE
jgi:hypothetical protein